MNGMVAARRAAERGSPSPRGRARCAATLAAALVLSACARGGRPDAGAAAATKPTVVATIFPLADIASQIAGEACEVVTLVPAGASPHTFDPSPDKARQVADAAVILRVGGGLDTWLDGLLSSSQAKVVTCTQLTPLLPAVPHHDEDEEPGQAHADTINDPHVWLDPLRVRDDLAPAITDALKAAAPDQATALVERLGAFEERMTQLDGEIRKVLDGVASRRYIATHPAWGYFNQRYGLELAATVERVPGADPSGKWLIQVIETAKREHVKAIFAEQQLSTNLVEAVAKDAGLRVGMLDPLGGTATAGRDSYEALMRYNAEQLAEGLQP